MIPYKSLSDFPAEKVVGNEEFKYRFDTRDLTSNNKEELLDKVLSSLIPVMENREVWITLHRARLITRLHNIDVEELWIDDILIGCFRQDGMNYSWEPVAWRKE